MAAKLKATRAELLDAIIAGIIETGRQTRTVVEAGPYLGFLDIASSAASSVLTKTSSKASSVPLAKESSKASSVPWMSCAIARDAVGDRAKAFEAVEELRIKFGEVLCPLRFELFDQYYPGHASVLEACGLENEGIDPLLVLTGSSVPKLRRNGAGKDIFESDLELRFIDAEDLQTLGEFVIASRRSFGSSVPDSASDLTVRASSVPVEDEANAHARDITCGRIRCAAGFVDNRIVSIATLVGVGAVAELAGVGTLPEYRRRGFAAAVSDFLITDHFSRQFTQVNISNQSRPLLPLKLVWLTAGSELAERVYTRIGFKRIGVNQINFEDTRERFC